jgi:nucleoside-diphosphate-sugar epimerase
VSRVLVTGATGFLGGCIVGALLEQPGVEIIAACREPARLPAGFDGEVRVGDLTDAGYRRAVVDGIDVVCHAAATASMWGHAGWEDRWFLEPSLGLGEQAVRNGVGRFVMAGTVVMGAPAAGGGPVGDDSAMTRTPGFWPHLERLLAFDRWMVANQHRGTGMVMLRLGHFVGRGNRLGMIPALLPRLRTRLVPWLDGGRRRVPLVGSRDLGRAFALAATAGGLRPYESFNICGPAFPTLREVITHIAAETGIPAPRISVPQGAGFAAGRMMESLPTVLPGRSPFLTRSIVHLCDDWYCSTEKAGSTLGYRPEEDWRSALAPQLAELAAAGFPWPSLSQYPRPSTFDALRRDHARTRSR